MNITRLSAENFGKMLVVTPFCVQNPPKELKKSSILWSPLEESWAFVRPFVFKITLDNWSNKLGRRRVLRICGTYDKITIEYQPKNSKNARCDTFCVQNPTKRSKKCSTLRARFERSWAFVTPFGFQIALDCQSQKLNEGFWTFLAIEVKIMLDYQPKSSKKCAFWHLLSSKSQKKLEKMLDIMGAFWGILSICENFGFKVKLGYLSKMLEEFWAYEATAIIITFNYQPKH